MIAMMGSAKKLIAIQKKRCQNSLLDLSKFDLQPKTEDPNARQEAFHNVTAPEEFLKLMRKLRETKDLSDMCLSHVWKDALVQEFID